jgi:hypothetical protein
MFTIDVRQVSLAALRTEARRSGASPEDPLTVIIRKDAGDRGTPWLMLHDVLPRPAAETNWGVSPAGERDVAVRCYRYRLAHDTPEFLAEFGVKFAAVLMHVVAGRGEYSRLLVIMDNVLTGPEPSVYIGAAFQGVA